MHVRRTRGGPKNERRYIVRFFAIAGALASITLVGRALFGRDGVERHERLRAELERVLSSNAALEHDNRRLRIESRALRSSADYMESVIRDQLGWVKKDDVVILFDDAVGDTRGVSEAK